MTNRIVARVAIAALFTGGLLGAASAGPFECPLPQPTSEPGVIKETPADIAELAPMLTGADVTAQIPAIIDGLHKRYPTAQAGEIANYLITAYCPNVARIPDLGDDLKTQRVQAFSKAVLGVLY